MTDTDPPKIEFPCPDYPIKIMGDNHVDFHPTVIELVEKHAPGFDQTKLTVRDSRNGRYQSITVFITATGVPQLQALHQELMATGFVKMVL